MSRQIVTPFEQFFDSTGTPLDNGSVYIGTPNLNPETNPVQVYWDDARTIPAAQPIKTSGGYMVRNGTPARVFADVENYSMTVKDKKGRIVWTVSETTSTPTITGAGGASLVGADDGAGGTVYTTIQGFLTKLKSSIGSSLMGFIQAGTGAVARTAQDKMRETVSVKDFGAVGDGVTDDTAAIQAAIAYGAQKGKSIYAPAGVYNITTLSLPQQHGGIEIFGEAFNSGNNAQTGVHKGTVFLSNALTGNAISCDGGEYYGNRGVRIRNLCVIAQTTGYAVYLRNSPEQNLLENLTIHNANSSGGNGVCLESCWVGTRVNGCLITSAKIGSSNTGLKIINALKAGGLSVQDCTINGFNKGAWVSDDVYQARFVNVACEVNQYGFYIDGNDPSVVLEQCHFEFNKDIAIYIKKSGGGVGVKKCTFYRNAETSSGTKAEIYVSSGGMDYNYNLDISNCWFFGIGNDVTAIHVSNSSYGSGVIANNSAVAFGTNAKGVFMGGVNTQYFEVVDNFFEPLATPYNPTWGYKNFKPALGANYQIRFSQTPVLSPDPNTLDDYEEGQWVPVLGGDGGQTGQSYADQVGFYQKIGNRVYFTFSATLTSKGSISAEAVLSGLPFPVGEMVNFGAGYVSDFDSLGIAVTALTLRPNPNSNKFYFRATTAAATSMGYQLGFILFSNTTTVRGGGWYVTG